MLKVVQVTYFGNAVNYESEQFFMCPMFVTECLHNKCLNCQPCVQFIFSPRCESDMILSVMTFGWLQSETMLMKVIKKLHTYFPGIPPLSGRRLLHHQGR